MGIVTLAWISIYVVACSAGIWLSVRVARTGRRGRMLSLVVWGVAIQLLMIAFALLTGYRARDGLEAGMTLALYPLPFATLLTVLVASRDKAAASSSRWQAWLAARKKKVIVRATTLGYALWVAEGTVLALASGGGVLAALAGVGLLGSLWSVDEWSRMRKRGWARRAIDWLAAPLEKRGGPARSGDVVRMSVLMCALTMALGIGATLGMHNGPPEWRVVDTAVTRVLGGALELDIVGVFTVWAALAGVLFGVAGVANPSAAQRRFVLIGVSLPLGVWVLLAALLPTSMVVWGVLLSGIMWLTLTCSLFVAEPTPATP